MNKPNTGMVSREKLIIKSKLNFIISSDFINLFFTISRNFLKLFDFKEFVILNIHSRRSEYRKLQFISF